MGKALNQHEQMYCVTRKELLAVVCALTNFHSYLYGQEVLLRTNNAAVSWMKSLKMPNGQVARWLQEIGNYNLIVTHRPDRQHNNAYMHYHGNLVKFDYVIKKEIQNRRVNLNALQS